MNQPRKPLHQCNPVATFALVTADGYLLRHGLDLGAAQDLQLGLISEFGMYARIVDDATGCVVRLATQQPND